MADIASNMTFIRWIRSKAEPFMDASDDFFYSTMVARGITNDLTLLSDTTEKQRDLCLADVYYNAAISSVKTGTQGESDGGWTHYVAIKNSINRSGLLDMAKQLYDKWEVPFLNPTNKIRMKNLY